MLNAESKKLIVTPELTKALEEMISSGQLDAYLASKNSDRTASAFSTDDKGNIKQCNENCKLALEYDELLSGAIRFNEMTNQMDIVREMPWKRFTTAFTDNDQDNIIIYLEKNYGLKMDKQIERAIRVVAKENSYHPVKDKLNSLVWDGNERLKHVLSKYLGVEDTPLAIESLKVFMLGAIERVFYPGCKFEYMLCLVGGQGAGKSSFLRYLAMEDEWFTDDIKKLSDKDIFEQLSGHWILEIPEMLAILKAKYVEETKSFISRQSDNYRIKYEKYSADHPRQCVFAGTSNRTEFLPPDKSGNRRFLPIEVDMANAEVHINSNPDETRRYFEQLWAEVMTIYQSGDYQLVLSPEMEQELKLHQKKFMPEDPLETAVVNYIEKEHPKYICTKLLAEEALDMENVTTLDRWLSNDIAEIINQAFANEYRKTSHYFEAYGKQKAWVLIQDLNEPEFKQLTLEEEKELPFK